MALSTGNAVDQAERLYNIHLAEREDLNNIRRYWKGRQALPSVIPSAAPVEVRNLARISRVNVCGIVVESLAQSTFVDNSRTKNDSDDLAVWDAWQANRLDARQAGIHRAAYAYGSSYAVVLPGDPFPVIRGVSPRNMTAVYGEDPDWPMWALEKMGDGSWRLYDDENIYYLSSQTAPEVGSGRMKTTFTFLETKAHGAGEVPVVRFLDEDDLDREDELDDVADMASAGTLGHKIDEIPMHGQIAPLMHIQDQIDLTTFGLLVAQWYSAFRQRYVLGWTADDESQKAKAGASQLWTFDVEPGEATIGEFGQTSLDGYISSREASLRHAATLSQTPVHELIGELVNLSADALAAAEAGHDRKVADRQTMLGESHEQVMRLAGQYMHVDVPEDAEVVWRDTSARAFSATVDALGKLAQMLGIPPEALWEKVPGATRQEIERWKAASATGNAFENLATLLDRQRQPTAPAPAPAPAPTV